MSMFESIISKAKRKFGYSYSKSYSQCGEDLIMKFLVCDGLKIINPTYLDIGAHHPFYLSNTYLFYTMGGHGVCVEPDPYLFDFIKKKRPLDICLNVGVGFQESTEADFFIMSEKTLNTFSQIEAERYFRECNIKIEAVSKTALLNVNEIMSKYFKTTPNIFSLDVEGIDLDILKSIDFNTYRPEVFCVETLTYTNDTGEQKITSIIEFMTDNGYMVFADTYINTIFVELEAWKKR